MYLLLACFIKLGEVKIMINGSENFKYNISRQKRREHKVKKILHNFCKLIDCITLLTNIVGL